MRPVRRVRSGFTMIETMIASAIGLIVLLAVGSLFITTQRMLKSAMAESELALSMRTLRDRLLFRVSPTVGGRLCAGLLSAVAFDDRGAPTRSTFENQVRQGCVELYAPTIGSGLGDVGSSGARKSVRLRGQTVGAAEILVNERLTDAEGRLTWLWPGRMSLASAWSADRVDFAAVNRSDANNLMIYRLYLDLALKANVRRADGSEIVRRERVSIPLCGRIQKYNDKNTDNKDTY